MDFPIVRALFANPKRLSYLARFFFPGSRTRWASVFFTRKCNRQCSYCHVPRTSVEELSIGEWFQIVSKLRSFWGVLSINVVGGEPTMRSDLEELVRHIYDSGIIPVLTSNGDFLTPRRIQGLADVGLQVLQISVDSLHGNGKSNENALNLLNHAKSAGVLPVLCSVASAENAEEIPEIARTAQRNGIVFNCSFKQTVGGEFSVADSKPPMTRSQARSLVSFLTDFKTPGPLSDQDVYLDTLEEFTYDRVWKCNPLSDKWITVNADGTLMRCQEYSSDFNVMRLTSRHDPAWIDYKARTVARCKGCYWQTYVEKEHSYHPRSLLLGELKTMRAIARTLAGHSRTPE